MAIVKDIFRILKNGVWDEHYFKTSADQVVYTKADGTASNVQKELDAQNSALDEHTQLLGKSLKAKVISKTVTVNGIEVMVDFTSEINKVKNTICIIPFTTTHSKNALVVGYGNIQYDQKGIIRYQFPHWTDGVGSGSARVSLLVLYT